MAAVWNDQKPDLEEWFAESAGKIVSSVRFLHAVLDPEATQFVEDLRTCRSAKKTGDEEWCLEEEVYNAAKRSEWFGKEIDGFEKVENSHEETVKQVRRSCVAIQEFNDGPDTRNSDEHRAELLEGATHFKGWKEMSRRRTTKKLEAVLQEDIEICATKAKAYHEALKSDVESAKVEDTVKLSSDENFFKKLVAQELPFERDSWKLAWRGAEELLAQVQRLLGRKGLD